MKKFVFLIIIYIFALFGCTNQHDAYKEVEKAFPKSEILQCDEYSFCVLDSSGIYFVKCLDLRDGRITKKITLKKWQGR